MSRFGWISGDLTPGARRITRGLARRSRRRINYDLGVDYLRWDTRRGYWIRLIQSGPHVGWYTISYGDPDILSEPKFLSEIMTGQLAPAAVGQE